MEIKNESDKKSIESVVANLKEGQPDPAIVEAMLDKIIGRQPLKICVAEKLLSVLKSEGMSDDVFVAILKKIYLSDWDEELDEYDIDGCDFMDALSEVIANNVKSKKLLCRLSEDKELIISSSERIPEALAMNKNTSADALIRLSKWEFTDFDREKDFWVELASNDSNVPEYLLLESIAEHGYVDVIGPALENPRLTGDMLHKIVIDKKCEWLLSGYSYNILDNPNVRADTLALLLEDESPEFIADRLVKHKNTDEVLLRKITAMSPDTRVKRAIAGNPKTPADILNRLLQDDDGGVREAAEGNLNLSTDR